jgi:molecular chaperone GrpE
MSEGRFDPEMDAEDTLPLSEGMDEAGVERTELEALRAECDTHRDRLLRLAAEYDNYRKRTAREWNDQKARATSEVLREILELADNLERALAAPSEDAAVLRRGVELIAQSLQAKLRRFGVEAIEAEGQEFDPSRHEALALVDSQAVESQHVVNVVQRGYTLNGEVLRPAQVTVAR